MIELPILSDRERLYEETYRARKAIADEWQRQREEAEAACGPALDYAKWVLTDREGIEPKQVVYCCIREGQPWWKPTPEEAFPRLLERSTTKFYEHCGQRVYLFRFECGFGHIEEYRPQKPSALLAAHEAKVAKEEEQYRREHPLFFQSGESL